jgi:hypothetical protein
LAGEKQIENPSLVRNKFLYMIRIVHDIFFFFTEVLVNLFSGGNPASSSPPITRGYENELMKRWTRLIDLRSEIRIS